MDSDSDSYYEENFEDEQEMAGRRHLTVQVNLEESPESPQPGSPLPVLPPQPIHVGELPPVRQLPDDGTIFINFPTRADVFHL